MDLIIFFRVLFDIVVINNNKYKLNRLFHERKIFQSYPALFSIDYSLITKS